MIPMVHHHFLHLNGHHWRVKAPFGDSKLMYSLVYGLIPHKKNQLATSNRCIQPSLIKKVHPQCQFSW